MTLTLKRAQAWLERCGQVGMTIEANTERRPSDIPLSVWWPYFASHKYIVYDSYRPKMIWYGRTPREALHALYSSINTIRTAWMEHSTPYANPIHSPQQTNKER